MALSDYLGEGDMGYGSGSGSGGGTIVAPPPPAPPEQPILQVAPTTISAPPVGPVRGVSYPNEGQPGGASPASGVPLAAIPGGAAPRPAGFIPGTQTTTSKQALQYSDETLGAVGADLAAKRELEGATLDSEAAHGLVNKDIAHRVAAYDEATAIGNKMAETHQLNLAKEYHAKVQSLMQDAATDKEDPMKWYKDQSTGSKLLTSLGLMVAGFGFGYSGRGQNPMEYINEQIRASTEAQRAAHQHKMEGIQGKLTGYQELKEQFGDDERATLASQMAQRQALIAHLTEYAGDQTAPADARLRAAQYGKELSGYNATTLRELDEKQAISIERAGTAKYREAVTGANAPIGVRVKLDDGSTRVIPIAQAKELGLTVSPLDQRKEVAQTKLVEAQAKTEEGKAAAAGVGGTKQLAETAGNVASTAYDPLRGFQGTEGYKQALANEDFNSQLVGAWHASHPGIRLSPELIEEVLGSYMIKPGDTKDTVEQKKTLALQALGGGKAAVSPGAGATVE